MIPHQSNWGWKAVGLQELRKIVCGENLLWELSRQAVIGMTRRADHFFDYTGNATFG